MRSFIGSRGRRLLDAFWFVPALVAGGLGALAFAMVALDRELGVEGVAFAFGGDATAARDVLSVVAGSVITVAGLTFSLTVVTLQLVSGQFSPRSIPSFLADRANQVVAGWFVGVFAYCLLVLRTIRTGGSDSPGDEAFVPGLAVALGVVLGLVALGVLIFFIHHLANSIKVSSILARVGLATLATVDRVHPTTTDAAGADPPGGGEHAPSGRRVDVAAERPGFVERVLAASLAADLAEERVVIRIHAVPGTFVTPETIVASAWIAPGGTDGEALAARVRRSVPLADERSMAEDVGYGLRQLADIALRALSTGVNDPTTATTAVGYLRAALERLASRPFGGRQHRRGKAAVVVPGASFAGYLDEAFAEIGRAATTAVGIVVLEALAAIAAAARDAGALEREADVRRLAADVAAHLDPSSERDRHHVDAAAGRVLAGTRDADR